MRRLTLTIATGLALAAGAADAGTWTATGPNGGSGGGEYTCSRDEGTRSCNGAGSWTGPNGQTSTWISQRQATRAGVRGEVTSTGPRGRERTTIWRRTR